MCPVVLYEGCEAKVNPCCMKLSRRAGGGQSEANDPLAGLLAGRSASLFNPSIPASSSSSIWNAAMQEGEIEGSDEDEDYEEDERVEEARGEGQPGGPVSEWIVPNDRMEGYHNKLIGVRALLYEGCEWFV